MSTSNPRTAIVDADCDASVVANANVSTKRQSAVSGCQCRTIKAFSARRLVAAETITPAINARYFRTRGVTQKQQNCANAANTNPRLQSGPSQSESAIFRTSLASPRCRLLPPHRQACPTRHSLDDHPHIALGKNHRYAQVIPICSFAVDRALISLRPHVFSTANEIALCLRG